VPVLKHPEPPQAGGMAGTTWGYDALDEATGGIRAVRSRSSAAPGSAKSAIGSTSRSALPTGPAARAFVSAEMPKLQVGERILNTTARIDSKAARKGRSTTSSGITWSTGVRLKPLNL
jgi:replicative DNA helicase